MLASASYTTRKGLTRPFARVTAQRRRLSHKLAIGMSPAQVGRLEGMRTAEVEILLAEPGFASLVEGYRSLHAMPAEEQRHILTSLARHLLMEAVALGDVRVATFILLQERIGKDPRPHVGRWRDRGEPAARPRGTRPGHAQRLATPGVPVGRSRPPGDAACGDAPA